ncbi:MAG TPA: hypothetical protein VF245_12060 [Solirubrobacterales bacterium]
MAQSKTLRPDWLPAVGLSAALAALMLAWNPQVGDLAAQVFRTELFQHAGLAIWNGSWYGGHYTLTYSVLFPPLAALIGPQLVGTISVVASAYLFDRLVRDRWGEAARWATLWFAAGVVTLLADGQLTFALGVAFGLATLRALQTDRTKLSLLAAAACALSSPVAATFLAGVLLVGAWNLGISQLRFSRGWRRRGNRPKDALATGRAVGPCGARTRGMATLAAALSLVVVLVPNLVFPNPGQFPFAFSSYVAIPLFCGGVLFVTRGLAGEERQLRRVLLAYALAATALLLVPNPLGGNVVRLGALFGGPVLAAAMLSHRPRLDRFSLLILALALAGGLYWQVTASVSQIARSVGDPSTSAAYFEPPARWLAEHGGAGVRIEVPPTANHWESAYLAGNFELARGWLRQLDTTRDDIFYDDDSPLTGLAYERWLRGNAISYVALPDAPLDYSSEAERRLILSAPSFLDLRWSSPHWRIYAVRDPKPLVEPLGAAAARTLWVGRQGFGLDVSRPGEFLVRVNFTPYWSIERGAGCLLRRGEWTVARASHPGVFRVAADFSVGRAWNAVTGAKKTC